MTTPTRMSAGPDELERREVLAEHERGQDDDADRLDGARRAPPAPLRSAWPRRRSVWIARNDATNPIAEQAGPGRRRHGRRIERLPASAPPPAKTAAVAAIIKAVATAASAVGARGRRLAADPVRRSPDSRADRMIQTE